MRQTKDTKTPLPQEAWLVAAGDYRRPLFWSGAGWSGNASHAVLMVRRTDAQRVALNMGLLGCEWDVPDDVRAMPAIKLHPSTLLRGMGNWRVSNGHVGQHAG